VSDPSRIERSNPMPAKNSVKTLEDVRADMSELYEQVKNGECDLKLAAELANITGKFLKATHLELAREIFLANHPTSLMAIEDGRP
jgi:hypothetical protein